MSDVTRWFDRSISRLRHRFGKLRPKSSSPENLSKLTSSKPQSERSSTTPEKSSVSSGQQANSGDSDPHQSISHRRFSQLSKYFQSNPSSRKLSTPPNHTPSSAHNPAPGPVQHSTQSCNTSRISLAHSTIHANTSLDAQTETPASTSTHTRNTHILHVDTATSPFPDFTKPTNTQTVKSLLSSYPTNHSEILSGKLVSNETRKNKAVRSQLPKDRTPENEIVNDTEQPDSLGPLHPPLLPELKITSRQTLQSPNSREYLSFITSSSVSKPSSLSTTSSAISSETTRPSTLLPLPPSNMSFQSQSSAGTAGPAISASVDPDRNHTTPIPIPIPAMSVPAQSQAQPPPAPARRASQYSIHSMAPSLVESNASNHVQNNNAYPVNATHGNIGNSGMAINPPQTHSALTNSLANSSLANPPLASSYRSQNRLHINTMSQTNSSSSLTPLGSNILNSGITNSNNNGSAYRPRRTSQSPMPPADSFMPSSVSSTSFQLAHHNHPSEYLRQARNPTALHPSTNPPISAVSNATSNAAYSHLPPPANLSLHRSNPSLHSLSQQQSQSQAQPSHPLPQSSSQRQPSHMGGYASSHLQSYLSGIPNHMAGPNGGPMYVPASTIESWSALNPANANHQQNHNTNPANNPNFATTAHHHTNPAQYNANANVHVFDVSRHVSATLAYDRENPYPSAHTRPVQHYDFVSGGHRSSTQPYVPPLDIYETPEAYLLYLSLPGVQRDDVDLAWDHYRGHLVVSGSFRSTRELAELAVNVRNVGRQNTANTGMAPNTSTKKADQADNQNDNHTSEAINRNDNGKDGSMRNDNVKDTTDRNGSKTPVSDDEDEYVLYLASSRTNRTASGQKNAVTDSPSSVVPPPGTTAIGATGSQVASSMLSYSLPVHPPPPVNREPSVKKDFRLSMSSMDEIYPTDSASCVAAATAASVKFQEYQSHLAGAFRQHINNDNNRQANPHTDSLQTTPSFDPLPPPQEPSHAQPSRGQPSRKPQTPRLVTISSECCTGRFERYIPLPPPLPWAHADMDPASSSPSPSPPTSWDVGNGVIGSAATARMELGMLVITVPRTSTDWSKMVPIEVD